MNRWLIISLVVLVLAPELIGTYVVVMSFLMKDNHNEAAEPITIRWWEYPQILIALYYLGIRIVRYYWYTLRGLFNEDWLYVRDYG